jgi:glycosyltransferase involved in cell wall biosynthesis
MTEVSIVVPLYNEQENVARLCAATHDALSGMRRPYEIVLVDDGSSDDTALVAAAIARSDARVRLVVLARNSGQTAAMAAGMAHARGLYLVTMDGDRQNDPADIPLLVHKLDEGYEIVVGWRHRRQDKLISRKIPSRIANWLIESPAFRFEITAARRRRIARPSCGTCPCTRRCTASFPR